MEFINIDNWITLAVTTVLVILIYILSEKKRKKSINSMLSKNMISRLASSACNLRRNWRNILFMAAWFLLGFCLMRPYSGTDYETRRQSNRDILILLDVSNSMNVIDCYGESRLNYSKRLLSKLSKQFPTDRFGLISFAGIPFLEMPLTSDSFSFEQAVQDVDSNNIPYGGTNIEVALAEAENELKKGAVHKAVILISDGEEISGNTEQIVKNLVEKKITVVTVQTGDEKKQGTVRDANGTPMRSRSGEVLTSSADGTILANLADKTGGTYLEFNPAGQLESQLKVIINKIEKMTAFEGEDDTVEKPREIFQPFLIAAIILLIIRLFLGERKKYVQVLSVLCLCLILPVRAQDLPVPPATENKLTAEQQLKLDELKKSESKLAAKTSEENLEDDFKALAWYNLGVNLTAQYALNPAPSKTTDDKDDDEVEDSFSRAKAAFETALSHCGENTELAAAANHNLGTLNHKKARLTFMEEPDDAILNLTTASKYYKSALVLNAGDEKSRKNLELSYLHKKEAEIAKEIKKLHEEAKENSGQALIDIRQWTNSKADSLKESIRTKTAKASQAVVKAGSLAKSIEQSEPQKLYSQVDSHLRKVLSEVENLQTAPSRQRAEVNEAESYRLLGGNPNKPQEQNQQDQQDQQDQKDENQQGQQDQQDQKNQDNNEQNQKNQQDQKNQKDQQDQKNQNAQNNKKDQDSNKEDGQKHNKKMDPEKQKGDFEKNDRQSESQALKEKEAEIREAEALLRKMKQQEEQVREMMRRQRALDILREMRRQGIYVPPEADK